MGFVRGCFNPAFMFRGGGGFMMIFFWGLLIVAAFYLFKYISGYNNQKKGYENYRKSDSSYGRKTETELSPEEIARRRYAKGEIDKEEFERIKNDLRE
ncbi:MAG TPA: SHOCT domain-containing protein [Halanaerobiales bacterium]|nr:SHOCT domain-containing protein [Halanaerobiales bacterium]